MYLLAQLRQRITQNEQDLSLMLATRGRDQSAFAQLYDRYAPLVYSMLLRMVRSADEAQDILQEVFLQVWNKAPLFAESRGSVYTWIMTITRRKAIDYLRSPDNRTGGTLPDDDGGPGLSDLSSMTDPLNAAISAEHEAFMREGLAGLREDQRTIIELSFYEGFTQAQIADRLALPLGTVKTRMRQGLVKLRAYLKERLKP